MEVTASTSFTLPQDGKYFVTAVNRHDNSESEISEIVNYSKQEQINGITPVKVK